MPIDDLIRMISLGGGIAVAVALLLMRTTTRTTSTVTDNPKSGETPATVTVTRAVSSIAQIVAAPAALLMIAVGIFTAPVVVSWGAAVLVAVVVVALLAAH